MEVQPLITKRNNLPQSPSIFNIWEVVWSVYCLKVKNSWGLLKGDDGVEFSGW